MRSTVNCTAVYSSISKLKQFLTKTESSISDIQNAYQKLKSLYDIPSYIEADIRRIILSAQNNNFSILQLCDAYEKAMQKYNLCENKLLGFSQSAIDVDSTKEVKEISGDVGIKWGNLISILGQFGTVGGLASSLFSVADNKENVGKSVSKIVDSGAKTLGRIADGKKIDIWGTSTVDAIGFRENLAKSLDGYKINSSYNSNNMSVAAKNAHNVSAVAKWSGIAISGMLNLVDNMEEYEYDLSNPRIYAETVGETAADFALGLFVGAGVATLAGAAAPVWAVGVVGAGVTMGLNWVSEQLTGKDVSELVSDTALYVVEATGTVVKKAVEGVGDAIKATADCISAGWKKITSLF